MSPRASSKRPSTAPSREHPSQRAETAEVRRARKAALLQLRTGRLAHVIGIASALALALTAVIAYGLVHWDFLADAPSFFETLKWIIPLVAGAAVAVIALAVKWEPYVADRNEPHFVMSVVAFVAPLFMILLIILDEYSYVVLGRPDWLYPASLLGISLAEISLAMTWEGTGSRKVTSIAAAVFPVLLMFFPMIWNFTDTELASILPMAYLGSAVSIHLSGSMLHIIASSTSVQQREVLKASDSRLKEEFRDVERKRQALAYREDALRSKESELEAYEKRLLDEMEAVEERGSQATAYEGELEQRLQVTREEMQRLAKQQAEIEDLKEILRMKQSDLDIQRGELDRLAKAISTKETTLFARERDANKLLIDSESKDREVKHRLSEIQAQEADIESMRLELQEMESGLAEREKQLATRESSLDLKTLEVSLAKEQLGTVSADKVSMKNLEQQLLTKQEQLTEKERSLRALEDDMRQRSEKAERLIARADKQMNELVEKENTVLERQKALADRESTLRAELERLNSEIQDLDRTKTHLTGREKEYHDLTETTRTKLSAVAGREEEISRKMAALEKRETKIKELETRLLAERESMNSKLKELLEKEKDLEAEGEEVALKQAELKALERDVLESVDELEDVRAEYAAEEEDDRTKVLDFRERQLMQKEQELKSRLYQREKELEQREKSLRTHLEKDLEDMEEAVDEEYAGEKIKTGITRIDDLLMGGMPFGSSVLYIGPPFLGKEVAMELFVAEGLKKGVPCVIVTTSKPTAEFSKEMGPILPTFKEFEQLGLVHWIDATGLEAAEPANGNGDVVRRVSGPADFDGILKALDELVKSMQKDRHPYFRLVYLSLSMSITQADERRAFQFVQTIAGRTKQGGGIGVYAVERGMHTEQQLESIQHHMSGAIQFKSDKGKTLLSVQGIGDAQTREWVEYKHTNKALMVGAFSLERIR